MLTSDRIRLREHGLMPVVVIDKELGERMASTIRHNRARGSHSVDLMSNIVAELLAKAIPGSAAISECLPTNCCV